MDDQRLNFTLGHFSILIHAKAYCIMQLREIFAPSKK